MAGRQYRRAGMIVAAQINANTHPHWKAKWARLETCLWHNKGIVAIARKLLVMVWHILSKHEADKKLNLACLVRKFYKFPHTVCKVNCAKCDSVSVLSISSLTMPE